VNRYRRRDPQPLTHSWEAPVLVLAGLAGLIGGAALAGQGVAAALLGGGWVWPDEPRSATTAVAGLATGHPGAGLTAAQAARPPGRSTPGPGPGRSWACSP
jgi:hypothetical protein